MSAFGFCRVEVCPTCGKRTDGFDRKMSRCLSGCGHMLVRLRGCGENGHADGSSDVFHDEECDGCCGYPKEGKPPKRTRRSRSNKERGG